MAADHYRTLGVQPDAPPTEILAAYRTKAATLHPDAGGSPYTWAAIQATYDTRLHDYEFLAPLLSHKI